MAAKPSARCFKTSGMDCPNGMKGMCSISKKDPPRGSFPCAKGLGALRVPDARIALVGYAFFRVRESDKTNRQIDHRGRKTRRVI